jgi:hypothetical protein
MAKGTIVLAVLSDREISVTLANGSKGLTLGFVVQDQHVGNLGIDRIGVHGLGLGSRITIRIASIPIPQSNLLIASSEDVQHVVVDAPERGPRERCPDTDDPGECLLLSEHAVLNLRGRYRRQIGMVPGVGTNHVPGVECVSDTINGLGVVDAVEVVAVEEERGFPASIGDEVRYRLEVDVWP